MTAVFARLIDAASWRRALLASAAALPLLQAAPARADTTISTAVTTPIATSSVAAGAPDNIYIDGAGSVAPTTPGAAVTIDSDNSVSLGGAIKFNNVEDAVGILAQGGRAGVIQSQGLIEILEDHSPTDADNDGDLDGPAAVGARRYGIRVTGAQPFTGQILNLPAGRINVEGVDSAGISVETRLNGHLVQAGASSKLVCPPTSRSSPIPPRSWSLPSPPKSRSLPSAPSRKSLPAPPSKKSLPSQPKSQSSPAPPRRRSFPPLAHSISQPSPPSRIS